MKLVDIIKEDNGLGFTTKQTHVDPETGQVTWDVEYTPLTKIDSDLDKMLYQLEKAVKDNPGDAKLASMVDIYRNWKKAFRTHVTRTYRK